MKKWAIRFKDRQPSAAEMTFLASEFYDDLVGEKVTAEEFAAADRYVCKTSRFFPVMADILTGVQQYRDEANALYSARAKWRRDNEWKKTFPELLTPSERKELGVSPAAIESAVDRGDIDKGEFQRLVRGVTHSLGMPK